MEGVSWTALRRLRENFIGGHPGATDYWESDEALHAYNATFAQRIAWKWYAVTAELERLGWTPPSGGVLLDWGCGSGVAGRIALDTWGPDSFSALSVFDKSTRAMEFARSRARERFPGVELRTYEPGPISLLVLSHVVNELDAVQRHELFETIARAETVVWVEPGTHAESRRLGAIREELRDGFRIIAPCPHSGRCGVFDAERERDWCHFFARPPTDAFTDPNWARFSNELGIDLRSLPYSYLVLDRRPPAAEPQKPVRLLGRHGFDKVAVRTLACQPDGSLVDRDFTRREHAAIYKRLSKHPHQNHADA